MYHVFGAKYHDFGKSICKNLTYTDIDRHIYG